MSLSLSPSSSYLLQQKILLGACHEIYVRLTALHHRTQDRHTFSVSTRAGLHAKKQSFHFHALLYYTKRPALVLPFLVDIGIMTTTLKDQAWQSGLVLLEETPEWNFEDWPPLEGGWRYYHASVVLNPTDNNEEQTVVVLGGFKQGQGYVNSILVLNLAEYNKQWREGPPMNKRCYGHAAVVCNGGVYVMGGYSRGLLDCIERIDANNLLRSSLTTITTQDSHWKTLTCRLSKERHGCCAAAVHNRYIVVMGGYNNDRYLSSVDIIDTNNHTVTAGPSMTVPRQLCGSAVIGHRIFVVGGHNDNGHLDSVEYLEFTQERKDDTLSTVISFSSAWNTHSEMVLSNPRTSCAVVAVGSCLVVAGGRGNVSMEVLDTNRNRVWNLLPCGNRRDDFSMVTVANQVAVISGFGSPTCATLPLLDKHTWCFQRLCEQQPNRWFLFGEGRNIQHADISPFSTSTSAHKRARPNTRRGDEGKDGT